MSIRKKTLNRHYSFKDLNLVVYRKKEQSVDIYYKDSDDEVIEKTISHTEFDKFFTDTSYLNMGGSRKNMFSFDNSNKELSEVYREYIENADFLNKISKRLINMYRTSKYIILTRVVFCTKSNDNYYHNNEDAIEPEHLTYEEDNFLTTLGGLIYANKGTFENAISYDGNSWYPSCMLKMNFPVKVGKFKKLKKLPSIDELEYGQYRVHIDYHSDPKINALFTFSAINKYTHYDLQLAELLGLKYSLIVDDDYNALVYSEDKLDHGKNIFGSTINYLYDLRQQHNHPTLKLMLSALWGSLCADATYSKTWCEDDIELDDIIIRYFDNTGDSTVRIIYSYKSQPKATPYARIGPFLTAKSRLMIANRLLKYKDNIIRIHTDGFIVNKEIPTLKLGKKLGEFKKEHEGTVTISYINKKPIWE